MRFKPLKHCQQLSLKFQFLVESTNMIQIALAFVNGSHAHWNTDSAELLVTDPSPIKVEASV